MYLPPNCHNEKDCWSPRVEATTLVMDISSKFWPEEINAPLEKIKRIVFVLKL